MLATSTPNLVAASASTSADTLTRNKTPNRSHFYSNAAPSKVRDGNVFRYDFVEQENAPIVDRGLKPKTGDSFELGGGGGGGTLKATRQNSNPVSAHIEIRPPPCIDRKLKPATPKV